MLSALAAGGIEITAIHEHLPPHSPTVWWQHIHATGDALHIAATLKAALGKSGTPLTAATTAPVTTLPGLDPAALDKILGRTGTTSGGVHKYGIPRRQTVTIGSMIVPPSQAQTVIAFQPTGNDRAAVNGDIVMTAAEVPAVLAALLAGGLEIIELHNHMLDETPRLFYVHFWAVDNATKLATALRAALDKTNARP